MSNDEYKTCDICKEKTKCEHDVIFFGDWQQSREITVHYFCLLLSTNLPQRGKDCSGINGFLMRDIRKEIAVASKRVCCYCGRNHASIQCHKCKEYFHLGCGRQQRCLFIFHGDFRSYCDECIPKEQLRPAALKSRPSSFERCSICREQMGLYNEIMFIFGKCCNQGYAHYVCVQKYALAAGYYLRCLWCRSEEFRNSVRLQGIFVPDRDARWEIQKEIYVDLHRGHSTCNMDTCFCPNGRDFNRGKWSIILCSLCGSVGAHNPKCLLGKENAKEPVSIFKCTTCARTEERVANKGEGEVSPVNHADVIDKSIFMTKTNTVEQEETANSLQPSFSDDEDTESAESFITVIPQTPLEVNSEDAPQASAEKKVQNGVNIKPVGGGNSINNITVEDIVMEMQEACVIIDEPTTQQPCIINIEDEETQIFVADSADQHKTKAVEEITSSPDIIIDEPTTQPPLIVNIEDEETQIFVADSADQHKTKAVEEITYSPDIIIDEPTTQPPLIVNIENEETQIFVANSADQHKTKAVEEITSNPDIPKAHYIAEALPVQQPLALDVETQVFDISSPGKIQIIDSSTKLAIDEQNSAEAEATSTAAMSSPDTTQDLCCKETTIQVDDSNQSPVVTSSSQIADHEDWFSFDVYEYDDTNEICIGTATVRINKNEERFAGMTLEQIVQKSVELIQDEDIISRTDDTGIFAKINAIIAQYK